LGNAPSLINPTINHALQRTLCRRMFGYPPPFTQKMMPQAYLAFGMKNLELRSICVNRVPR
jgi:hypothetical protein